MESYYTNQASSLPYFSGHYRQRGSGFGALASGIGRIALPLARKFILPAATCRKRTSITKCARVSGCCQQKKIRKAGVEKHYFEHS